MKRFILFSFTLLCFAACQKSSDDTAATIATTSTDPAPVTASLLNATWKINYLIKNGGDSTSRYASYKLTFANSNVLSGANDLLSKSGTWTVTSDSGKTKLTMSFTDPQAAPNLSAVEQDWEITSRTAKIIVMQHVSGGGGPVDYLTIEKI